MLTYQVDLLHPYFMYTSTEGSGESRLSLHHTGKCIRRFGGIHAYRPEVVDIGVNTI